MSADTLYNTSKAASGELVDSLLGGTYINYIGHMACVCRASGSSRKERKQMGMAEMARQKELAGGQERNRLHRETRNGVWLSAIPHRLNSTELSQEEFRDNIRLRYRLMPQDIRATCDGCGKRFSIKNSLSCPKGGLFMVRNDDAAKEWGALGAQELMSCAITY